MFNKNYYVPILKWKQGEQKALQSLQINYKTRFTPLIEIVSIPYNHSKGVPAKTIDEHLKNIGKQLKDSWGISRPIFIDSYWLDNTERMSDGRHPLRFILDEARQSGISSIPVTGSKKDSLYNSEVRYAIQKDKIGVCIRLQDEDFLDISNQIKLLLNNLSVSPPSVDLVIDFRYIAPDDVNKSLLSLLSIINSIPYINDWRNLILCCSSFPVNLSQFPKDAISSIIRFEWLLWKKIKQDKSIARLPIFGDYTAANPEIIEIDPRFMDRSAAIRYTVENNWLICKGRSVKRFGSAQTYMLSDMLIRHNEYCGKNFCWGDNFIYECAMRTAKGPGSATTWRTVGTNHHITFVVEQLGKLP